MVVNIENELIMRKGLNKECVYVFMHLMMVHDLDLRMRTASFAEDELATAVCHSSSDAMIRRVSLEAGVGVEFERARPRACTVRARSLAGTYPMTKESGSCTPSCFANLLRMRSRTSRNGVACVTRTSTITESSSIALIASASGPVGLLTDDAAIELAVVGLSALEAMETRALGELGADQGRWNCPGGRFWKGLGNRSGGTISLVGCWCLVWSVSCIAESTREGACKAGSTPPSVKVPYASAPSPTHRRSTRQ